MISKSIKKIFKISKFTELIALNAAIIPILYLSYQLNPLLFLFTSIPSIFLYMACVGSMVGFKKVGENFGPISQVFEAFYIKSIKKDAKESLKALGFLAEKNQPTFKEVELVKDIYVQYQSAALALILKNRYKDDAKNAIFLVCQNAHDTLSKHESSFHTMQDGFCERISQNVLKDCKIDIVNILNIWNYKIHNYKENEDYIDYTSIVGKKKALPTKILQSSTMFALLAKECQKWSHGDYKIFLDFTTRSYIGAYELGVIEAIVGSLNSNQVSFTKLKSMALERGNYPKNIIEIISKKISAPESLQQSQEFIDELIEKNEARVQKQAKRDQKIEEKDLVLKNLHLSSQSARALKPQWESLIEVYEKINQKLQSGSYNTYSVNQTKLKIDLQGMIPQLVAFEKQLLLVEDEESKAQLQESLKVMIEQVTKMLKAQSKQLDLELAREMSVHSKYLHKKI